MTARLRTSVGFAACLLAMLALAACSSGSSASTRAATSPASSGGTQSSAQATASSASRTETPSSSSAATSVSVPRASSSAGPDGTRIFTITSEGHRRTFVVYAPTGGKGPHPLVLVYHGVDDTAVHTLAETDFASVAGADDQIVVYPQGYDNSWNEGAGNTPAHAAGFNDVVFTQQIVRYMEAHYAIDRHRIAAAGISNGALLTELLGCRIASQITEIVPIEGQLPVSVSPGCRPSRPITVLEVHGTADTAIPYGGGHFNGVGGGTTVLSAPASARRWATLDGCRMGTPSSQTSGDSTFTTYSSCSRGVTVTLDTIHGGQHVWPANIGVLVGDSLRAHPARENATTP